MAQRRRDDGRFSVMTIWPSPPVRRSAGEVAGISGPGFFPRREEPSGTPDEVIYVYAAPGPATTETAVSSVVQSIDDESVQAESIAPMLRALAAKPQLVREMAELDSFDELAGLVETQKRRRGLEELDRRVRNPAATAETMLEILRREPWVFGNHLSRMDSAEQVPGLPGNCLPLVRFDAAIHAVLVETPVVPDLVKRTDDGLVLSRKVYEAADQARRIVELLDRRDATGATDRPLDLRRVYVAVLIGHSSFLQDETVRWADCHREIRLQNTFFAGFSAVTYDELVHTAGQLLPSAGPDEPAALGG